MSRNENRQADMDDLLKIMAALRNPDGGCPWDLEQDFSTIAPYTIEEAYEVADAIARNDSAALREELGDLLFQVVFHAQLARELGWFEFGDVLSAITQKLVRRHPHVFADGHASDARHQTRQWEQHKARERKEKGLEDGSALDGVTLSLPALVRAQKIQQRAALTGFDWERAGDVVDKLDEELRELKHALAEAQVQVAGRERIREELGDLMFTCVNLARFLHEDAESILRAATEKFAARFRQVEHRAQASNRRLADMKIEELEALWQQVKDSGTDVGGSPA